MTQPVNDPAALDVMIADSDGVKIIFADSSETWGHRATADQLLFEDPQIYGTEDLVLVATGKLPGNLKGGQAITVDGTGYVVVEHRRIEDGAITLIALGKA